ncbi:MAG: VWA domain-containing protein [Desulfurococcaceae archaeon]
MIALEEALNSVRRVVKGDLEIHVSDKIYIPLYIPHAIHNHIIVPKWLVNSHFLIIRHMLTRELLHDYWRFYKKFSSNPLAVVSYNLLDDKLISMLFSRDITQKVLEEEVLNTLLKFRESLLKPNPKLELFLYVTSLPKHLWSKAIRSLYGHIKDFINDLSHLRNVLNHVRNFDIFTEGGYREAFLQVYKVLEELDEKPEWHDIFVNFENRLGWLRFVVRPLIITSRDLEAYNSNNEFSEILAISSLTRNANTQTSKLASLAKIIGKIRHERRLIPALTLIQQKILDNIINYKYFSMFSERFKHETTTGIIITGINPRHGDKIVKKTLSRPPTHWLEYTTLENKACKHIMLLDVSGSMKFVIDYALTLIISLLNADDTIGLIAFNADTVEVIRPSRGLRFVKEVITKLIFLEADGGTDFGPVARLMNMEPETWSGDVLTIVSDFNMFTARLERPFWSNVNLIFVEELPDTYVEEKYVNFLNEVLPLNRFEELRVWVYDLKNNDVRLFHKLKRKRN